MDREFHGAMEAKEGSCRTSTTRSTSRSTLDGAGERVRPAAARAEADDDRDDDDDDDDLEDAAEDEIDFVLAAYREDGQPYVQALARIWPTTSTS